MRENFKPRNLPTVRYPIHSPTYTFNAERVATRIYHHIQEESYEMRTEKSR